MTFRCNKMIPISKQVAFLYGLTIGIAMTYLLTIKPLLICTQQPEPKSPKPQLPDEESIDFTNSNNITGFDHYIVPNIVHLIKQKDHVLSFAEMVCIRSMYLNHNPDKIYVHCDCQKLKGKYWQYIEGIPTLEIKYYEAPREIYGAAFSSIQHASDVARMQILKQYGGIYLDNDVYVVRSLNAFRRFEFALGVPPKANMGTQVYIAHKKARFIDLYLASYYMYEPTRWYYNAGQLPTTSIIHRRPGVVHIVPEKFGVAMETLLKLFGKTFFTEWRNYYTFHLFIRHIHIITDNPITTFDEDNVKTYRRTFGEMARMVLYGTVSPVPLNTSIVPINVLFQQIYGNRTVT